LSRAKFQVLATFIRAQASASGIRYDTDLQLKNKRAVVTGSTAGIGFAIAQALAAEGASVVVNGRTEKRVDAAIREIRKTHTDRSAFE